MVPLPAVFPGWKKIGWHLGRKIHDIIYPPDSKEPSEEELRAQRSRDVSQGFAYFNTFDEVIGWKPSAIDPLQQPNVPLCERALITNASIWPLPTDGNRTETLLCHDFKGGYLDCESVRPTSSHSAIYSCEYLHSVGIFVYFSHHLVSIPPPTWTNCLHTNGVKVLGTFILEPQTHNADRLFDLINNDGYVMAIRLTDMAEAFGFDGWLLNFEKELPQNSTSHIADFIEDLKSRLGKDRIVLWYDALSTHNKVEHQNGLTPGNTRFAQKADGLFTNYKWDLPKLQLSCDYAERCGIPRGKLFFGIDIWAQNDNMSGPPRVTFPEKGGGGTNTGLAMRSLAGAGVSTAIFAPGWTHEHFPTELNNLKSVADDVNESLWQGSLLPDRLDCDCKADPHHSSVYRLNTILDSATEYAAGSARYFHTDFSSAFRVLRSNIAARNRILPSLGLQSASVSGSSQGSADAGAHLGLYSSYDDDEEEEEGHPTAISIKRSLGVKFQRSPKPKHFSSGSSSHHQLRLYRLAIDCADQLCLQLHYSLREDLRSGSCELGLYLLSLSGDGNKARQNVPLSSRSSQNAPAVFKVGARAAQTKLYEVGIYLRGQLPEDTDLAVFHSMSILPETVLHMTKPKYAIGNLRISNVRGGPVEARKLEWEWLGDKAVWPDCLPWSRTTGPFSHFRVLRNDVEIGICQTTAYPLESGELGPKSNDSVGNVVFAVEGICFGGIVLNERALAYLQHGETR